MVKSCNTNSLLFLLSAVLLLGISESTSFSDAHYQKHVFQKLLSEGNLANVVTDKLLSNPLVGFGTYDQSDKNQYCQICKTVSFAAEKVFLSALTENVLTSFFKLLAPLVPYNVTETRQAIDMSAPVVLDAFIHAYLDPNYMCVEVVRFCQHSDYQIFPAEEFVTRLLLEKPTKIQDNNYVNNLYKQIKGKNRTKITAVQFADPHLDNEYAEGSKINCDGYLCCRAEHGYPTEPEDQAGEFGGYMCDLPEKTFKSMMSFVRKSIKPDLIFWTGDNAPHDIWKITEEEAAMATINVTNLIKEAFNGTNTTVYPIQGNHDVWPSNCQDFSKPNANKQINALSAVWSDWLDNSTLVEHSKYGYYSQVLKMKNGKKYNNTYVIALNTVTCYVYNWYLINNRYDPGDEIAWLEKVLSTIESKKGQAFIIAHIPTNTECLHSWSHRYRALTDRYQHIIRFGLFGHMHDEELMISRSLIGNKNIGVNFITGSLTTYVHRNPSFLVMELDEEYMIPVSFKTYFLNLTKANSEKKATWELMVDYKVDYNMTDMSPDSFYGLAEKIRDNETTAIQYSWNRKKQVDHQKLETCDRVCRLEYYCDVTSTEYTQNQFCQGRQYYDFYNDPVNSFFNFFYAEWIKEIPDPLDHD